MRTIAGCWLVVLSLVTAGCAQLEREAATVDALVARARSDDFAERQSATNDLLNRDPVILRHLVLPKLALASAVVPMEVASHDGNILRGRVTGGDEKTLELQTTKAVAEGALISIPLAQIKVVRLFPR